MNGYMFLSPGDAQLVRKDRIRQLEVEHFSALLVCEENPDDESAMRVVREFERRIEHHVQALTNSVEQQESASEAVIEEPDKPVIS